MAFMLQENGARVNLENDLGQVELLEASPTWVDVVRQASGTWTPVERAA